MREKPNKDALKDLIKNVKALDLNNYTAETASAVKAALTYAADVFEDENANQDRVDAAVEALNNAVNKLEATSQKPADETDNKVASTDNSNTDNSNTDKNNKVAGTTTNKNTTNKTVKTGDSTPFGLWGMMMALAAAGITVFTKKRRQD